VTCLGIALRGIKKEEAKLTFHKIKGEIFKKKA
jgi:hypothetical protein